MPVCTGMTHRLPNTCLCAAVRGEKHPASRAPAEGALEFFEVLFEHAVGLMTRPIHKTMAVWTLHQGLVTLELDELLGWDVEMADLADSPVNRCDSNTRLLLQQKLGAFPKFGLQLCPYFFL